MVQPSIVFAMTFMVTVFFIVWFSRVSVRLGLVDRPGGRKKHQNLVPLVGGIAIFGGTSLVLIPTLLMSTIYVAYWLASFLLTFICMLDDKKPLSSNVRFFIQFISLGIIIMLGKTEIVDLGDLLGVGSILLGFCSIPFTCFAMIGIINAVNMMDGLDGLTGGVSGIEFLVLFFLAIHIEATQEVLIIAAFIGAILGFLLFNFPTSFSTKRKVFLGDAGSMLIGLTLAWLCVRLTQINNGYPAALMLWVMALPLMDTVHLIINRKARGVSAFKADRRHIHHILLQLHYTSRQSALILIFTSLSLGASGVFLYLHGASDLGLFSGLIVLFLLYSMLSYLLKKQVVVARKSRLGDSC